jgi:hypothetical protein
MYKERVDPSSLVESPKRQMWHIGKILALDLKNLALKRSTGTGHSKETKPS